MNFGALDGDRVVQILGIVIVLALLSKGATFRSLSWKRRAMFGAAWAAIIAAVAVVFAILTR